MKINIFLFLLISFNMILSRNVVYSFTKTFSKSILYGLAQFNP